jgi:hypothetical protein
LLNPVAVMVAAVIVLTIGCINTIRILRGSLGTLKSIRRVNDRYNDYDKAGSYPRYDVFHPHKLLRIKLD